MALKLLPTSVHASDSFDVDPKGKTFNDLCVGMKDEGQAELEHVLREVASKKINPEEIALELPEEEEIDDDGTAHAIRAVAKVRAANKEKFLSGDKDGFDLRNGGETVKRETFLKAIKGMPENWKKNQSGDDTEGSNSEPEGEGQKPEAGDLLLTDPPYNVGYVGKTKDALPLRRSPERR